jgi:tRNA U34 5-carboxymethylaminomethyl modifying GTPase MnmE/TrmE
MLSNFKKHAKEQMQKKQKSIDMMMQQINDHQQKLKRITDRVHEKHILGIISDESDDEE